MEDETIKKLKEQHIENYKNAILENIKNNTNVLVDEDIMSLTRKPPLDSMDLIKSKFLDLAKKNKIILNIEQLDIILDAYRIKNEKCFDKIKEIRIDELSNKVKSLEILKDSEVIKINKKDFISVNKEIKKLIKNQLKESFENEVLKKMENIFINDTNEDIRSKIVSEVSKYVKGSYQKQLLDNIDFKILVKDTTLINGTKEQSERYLFTLNNSRLLNDNLGE
ncbi:MAG: hypothetical protein HFJ11_01655 [Bacilli bacterium]|nr:hypothetical protein [Bacilli bacterium]